MKLSQMTIEQIIEKFGKPIRYPSDYMELSHEIGKTVGQPISTNTVKRLLGFIVEDREPRLYTLDIISKYLGYENWDNYIDRSYSHGIKYSEIQQLNGIRYDDLQINDQIEFHYSPDRIVIIQKISKEGLFQVIKAVNCTLQVGDQIKVHQFIMNYPLFVDKIIRNGDDMGSYIAGKIGGITYLKKLAMCQD